MPTILEPQSTNPEVRLRAQIAELDRRLRALEGAGVQVPVVAGAPTSTSADGTLAADTTGTGKIWLRVNGVWRSVAVS